MSWADFRDRLDRNLVILLPLGSQEEQGPHAPMGDYRIAEHVALRAAERADAVCAPVLPFGYAEFFRGVPGGIQLRADTFRAILRDMIGAFLDHGIDRIVICNGHTSNAPLIADVTQAIRREQQVTIPSLNLWRALPDGEWTRLYGENAGAARGHGADPLTSLYLHLSPELVCMDRAGPEQRLPAFGLPTSAAITQVAFNKAMVDLPLDVSEVAPDGVVSGDPRHATAEIGRAICDWTVDWVAAFVAHFRGCDPRAPSAGSTG